MDRLSLFKKMVRERRVGFMLDEQMTGSHHFINEYGPEGEHPMSFRITWGSRHLGSYLNPFSGVFLSNFVEGTIRVGGFVDESVCKGTLDLRVLSEGKIRYTLNFKDQTGKPYRYVGEKKNIRPWNLPETHTTCFGTISDWITGKEISESILHFKWGDLPAFLKSFRLG